MKNTVKWIKEKIGSNRCVILFMLGVCVIILIREETKILDVNFEKNKEKGYGKQVF